jgi:hypothetical protein
MGTGMGAQPTLWDWLQFCGSIVLVAYAFLIFVGDRVPALGEAGTRLRRLTWRLLCGFLGAVEALGAATEAVLLHLWRGPAPAPKPAPKPAPVSTVSYPRQPALMSRPPEAAAETPTDHGLSGLSAPIAALPAPDPLDSYLETLDTYSRAAAVAILVDAGWPVGKIRARLTGDSGAIGREAEAARAALGLGGDEDEPRTPLAGRPIADGVAFPQRSPTS